MDLDNTSTPLRIEVVYSPAAGVVEQVELVLPAGSTLERALRDSGLLERHRLTKLDQLAVGIWGRRATLGDALREHDRVEIYRPLQVDPKEARRLRYRAHLERYPSKR
jgi:putative ubiquitin-RnfH superfamily antitoxin RatB of RatAB toxin-antitoxin module